MREHDLTMRKVEYNELSNKPASVYIPLLF